MQIEYLNGLRGVCALWVVAVHELMIFLPMALSGDETLRHLGGRWEEIMANLPFQEGNFAVCIFFLLSAFVLSLRYWQQDSSGGIGCLADAACRRYIRLAGPVFGAMLIAWMLSQAGCMRNPEVAELTLTNEIIHGNGAMVFQTPMTWTEFLRTSLYDIYKTDISGLGRRIDFVLWTMPFEMQGSILTLAFLALLGNVARRDVFYVILCGLTSSTYFLPFPLGLWLADLTFARDREKLRRFLAGCGWLPYLCLCIGLYLGLFRDVAGNPMYDWLRELVVWPKDRVGLFHIVGGFFFLYAVLRLSWLQRLLGCRWMVVLGHYSFSLYLAHVPVLSSWGAFWFLHFFRQGCGYGTALVLSFLLSLPAIALMTLLLDRLFDRPAKALARRAAHWLLGRKRAE